MGLDMTGGTWKKIPGYPEYAINNLTGQIMTANDGRIIQPTKAGAYVNLRIGMHRLTRSVKQLMIETFGKDSRTHAS